MFIPSIRIEKRNNPNPLFQRSFSVQKLSKAMPKEIGYKTPNVRLARVLDKQTEGSISTLEKKFNPEEIKSFFDSVFLKRVGQNWEITEKGNTEILQFFKRPTPIEKQWGRSIAANERALGMRV